MRRRFIKTLAVFMAVNLLFQILFPSVSWALTSGPSSPDFSSFEPVATTDMVDVFSGDFTYNIPVVNIPGSDGGGYALSLSYHSGASSEEEASWVGYGWTLNPGAINRGVRGVPDDYSQTPIKHYNKARPNWTITSAQKLNFEFFSKEEQQKARDAQKNDPKAPISMSPSFSLSVGTSLRANNYQGYNRSYNFGASFGGVGGIGAEVSATGLTFSADVDPIALLARGLSSALRKKHPEQKKDGVAQEKPKTDAQKKEIARKENIAKMKAALSGAATEALGSALGINSFEESPSPMVVSALKGYGINYSLSLMGTPSITPVGVHFGTEGTFFMQYNDIENLKATGYLHHSSSLNNDEIQDYNVEKQGLFDKRDYILGIPFANADNFSLSGEGLSGGFRAYAKKPGHYYPKGISNSMNIFNLGFQLTLGGTLGVGLTFGMGIQKTKVDSWRDLGDIDDYNLSDEGSDPLFIFNNDMGGEINYGSSEFSNTANFLHAVCAIPGVKRYSPRIDPSLFSFDVKGIQNSSDIQRSCYIKPDYEPGQSLLKSFSITNEDGNIYNYDENLKTKNETSLSVGLNYDATSGQILDPIINNSIVLHHLGLVKSGGEFDVNQLHQEALVGEIKTQPYSSTFLLSSILTPDYYDADGDNDPSSGDIGGWTKFSYFKPYNIGANGYRWRSPVFGFNYSRNMLSDVKDDMGSVSTGEKDVAYLTKIETKTHVAFFVTNKSTNLSRYKPNGHDYHALSAVLPQTASLVHRNDALGVSIAGGDDIVATNPVIPSQSTQELEYLTEIVVFAKAENGDLATEVPMQTVHFRYDYSLVPNLPNNIFGKYPAAITSNQDKSGKLTLRKVWTDFQGIQNARISPYEFNYAYKDWSAYQDVTGAHPELSDFFNLNNVLSSSAQNPAYSTFNCDAWGSVQPYGADQQSKLRTWPFQGNLNNANYDPGAWQLKQIKLPSGGEILIQYEAKDYSYVQDRPAMALTHLNNVNTEQGVGDYNQYPMYEVNLSDLGLENIGTAELADYCSQLSNYFVNNDHYIYFKFLYALQNSSPGINTRSEYIDGYSKVSSIIPGPNSIHIILDGTSQYQSGYHCVPRQACYDFFSANRVGKSEFGNQTKYEAQFDNAICMIADDDLSSNSVTSAIGNIITKFAFATAAIVDMQVSSLFDLSIQIPPKSTVGTSFNPELSYFKLPLFIKAKRGGGCRVARLLMFDSGLEAGSADIYGNEYHYVTENGQSSGVATNEPSGMKEENALVDFLPKKTQSWANRLISGADKEQSEGPVGEELLPGASVGHSRVVISNIFKGKVESGYSVHEFFTVKDYPFDRYYDYGQLQAIADEKYANSLDDVDKRNFDVSGPGVAFSDLSDNTRKDKLNIPTGVFNYSTKKTWAMQDFRFIINDMHGHPKFVKQFYGNYNGQPGGRLSSATIYDYFEPGEKVKAMHLDNNGQKVWDWVSPGKQMEVAMEGKQIKENTIDFGFSVDLNIGLCFWPPIWPTGFVSFSYSDTRMSTEIISKVIRYPTIMKSMSTYKDGIWSKTENLAYDYSTGKPVLTKITDSYNNNNTTLGALKDGSYYTFNLPAHWFYSQMDQKALASTNTNQLNAMSGQITSYGSNGRILGDRIWNYPERVLKASAQTYSNSSAQWTDQDILTEYNISGSTIPDFWRADASYAYRDAVEASSVLPGPNLNNVTQAGMTKNTYVPFNYSLQSQTQPSNWILNSRATKYSPNGNALEEVNSLNIYSSVRYGYQHKSMPVLIGKNAEYSTIQFKDFEFGNNSSLANEGHSGKHSLSISPGMNDLITSSDKLYVNAHLLNKGGVVRFWYKMANGNAPDPNDFKIVVNGQNFVPEKISQVGEWYLFYCKVSFNGSTAGDPIVVRLSQNINVNSSVDDIIFCPTDASCGAYVYDPSTYKLLAQFDDQHFAMFYQYDAEGKLIRKIVETERGLKTIQENQYNKPTVPLQ